MSTKSTDAPPATDTQRLESLRQVRQRVVELQAVRTYLQESGNAAVLLAQVDAQLAEALALEQTLIGQAPPRQTGTRRGRRSPLAAAAFLLAAAAEDQILAALELAWTLAGAI